MSADGLPVYRDAERGTVYFVARKKGKDSWGIFLKGGVIKSGVGEFTNTFNHPKTRDEAVEDLKRIAKERRLVKMEKISL